MHLKPLHLEICLKRNERKRRNTKDGKTESKGMDDKLKGDGMQ